MKPLNAISVDVEDYFQVGAFEHSIRRGDWDSLEHRIMQNMEKVLQLFAEQDVKGTFFMLSWVAERYPTLVKCIVNEGHELASHGHAHHRVTDLSREEFRQDVMRAKGTLEDLGAVAVRGYRAPSYSIGESNVWALDILAQTGYQYSSSIYPIRHDHYGFPDAPRFAFRDSNTGIIEIPISTVKIMNKTIPAGGGGFFRFYPYAMSRWIINRVNRIDGQPAVFYFHPWELDPAQPRQRNISAKTRFRHYINLAKTEPRLRQLLMDFNWGRMDEVFMDGRQIPEFALT
jgi:polysaccharide deacetylase family protein (PEP-CTERM system associated)